MTTRRLLRSQLSAAICNDSPRQWPSSSNHPAEQEELLRFNSVDWAWPTQGSWNNPVAMEAPVYGHR